MKKRIKQYSAEEKAKVALEALKGKETMAQINSEYGISWECSGNCVI